jgi:hypothetical protein
MSRTLLVVALTLVVAAPALAEPEMRESEDPIALVVLVEGHTMFIGNSTYEKDPTYVAKGVHRQLGAALDAFRAVGPTGSLGALVTYADKAEVRREMGPLTALDATALGVESDYRDNITRDLVAGIETSLGILRAATTPRKALIIIGDGADTNITTAKERFERLKRECAQDGIALYGIRWVALPGEGPTEIGALMTVETAATADELPAHAQRIADRIRSDGRVSVKPPAKADAREESRMWIGAVVAGGLILVIAGLLIARRVVRT